MKNYKLLLVILLITSAVVAQKPSPSLLNPTNHSLLLIDYEGQMGFATASIPIDQLRTNVAIISGASKIFKIPTVVTTVAEKSFSGPVFPEVTQFYPDISTYVDRTTMNTWEDMNAYKAITGKGKKRIVMAGLWTSVCIVGPVLSALSEGYEVYIITDACGDVSKEAHEMAVQRMIQAGAKPMTSMQYILELQRDWARQETYKAVNDLMQQYGGAYGIGIQYARQMLKH
ncbi:hydrolase [Flavobacterium aquatile]|uniref:Chloroperoxidase n=1 Tax=Flavobacterium aquatile LMG 4008 = ATCC 11947 TaxID=1453498 RepID=A0A095SY52_9FLAO|nr:hydrolase [Flavobacterium aquatile]KGD69581.1 chloroperoxidase [Flavobacterium aquatile LMG 4008 = ATCC 11947]OXA67284.1 hydrolase [Flavobacterium aquatile] [Flavobacterium aquatile LMG 4008 = ATCC 11947]GEC77943.1 hydrolase [Flavobacterium aquatile]